ncbi:CHAT domain-containing protein [Tolypothrix sp. FACHB-123]|uniref:CHAT domain-containing protein n=1 Tax=Tolypothrix sp. FACHB-123 TaxID=2692868 RepID=UPI001688BC77|nr:CHAT domain-containing protein [Tolypothrix sp. FACHB-123]MBD2353895.1 CHAT domain-containing protein [Tolypothrix sp. FACHB-123]
MLKRLWRWLKSLFRQIFGRKQPISPPLAAQETGEIRNELTDAEYESLFIQLLAGVHEEGWSRGRVKAFLDGKRINQAHLLEWLRGFGDRLLASPTANDELARRIIKLGELGVGEVSDFADDIGRRLLRREEETNRRGAEDAEEEGEKNITDDAEAWLDQGNEQFEAGDFAGAIASYDNALKIKPDYHEAWKNRGIALNWLQQYEQAILSCDNALKIKPDDHEAWIQRGFALRQLGKYEEAILSCDNALKIKPDYYEAWKNRGIALNWLQRYEQAILSCGNALNIKPDDSEAWTHQGFALRQLGKYEEAILSCDNALKIKPDYHEAWKNRGIALNWLQRYEQAILSCGNALNIKPDDSEAWTHQGFALCQLEKYEEAILSCDNALKIKPDEHEAWIHRGLAVRNSVSFNQFLAFSSAIAKINPHLNQRGYQGELISYKEGLKYCHQHTHPESWGKLHQAIGNAHYFRGRGDSHPRSYWYKAVKSYNEALQTLTAEDFPELHLKILQNLIHVQLDLGETAKAEELQRRGTDLLRRLLDECKSSEKKKQLALKFAGFQQLTVDLAIQSENFCTALELAEQGKNACLSWLLAGWSDDSPKWEEMKQLLNPHTAIVYWHLSPAALHTFILKHNTPSPIVLRETLLTPAQRLYNFETWVKTWNEEYANFRKGKDKQSQDAKTWRDNLPAMLDELGKILDINAIVSQLSDITQLILIPHRDLHRFPLHALFPPQFTISYLPSIQLGLISQTHNENQLSNQHQLLSIEHPENPYPTLEFAQVESEAICRIFPHNTRKRSEEATKAAVINALPQGYGILHFTGHGEYNFHNPALSHLALADEDKLKLTDIRDYDLHSYQLVCLAACETAITGNYTITTEYVGLVSGFMSCGVASVVSTLWTVESAASALVMIQFYQQLQQGKSKVVALAEATQWLRNVTNGELAQWYAEEIAKLPENEVILRRFLLNHLNNIKNQPETCNKPYNHPYFWAAFTITGIFSSCNH